MKPLAAGLAVLVLVAAFALGWGLAPAPPAPLSILAGRGAAAAAFRDPVSSARLDMVLLARSLADPAAAPSAFDEARPAAFRPAEPDLAYTFRRQLSAVVAEPGGGAYALLRDEGGTRMLRPGEVFQNGWKLRRLSMGEAAFARGKEVRTIGLFDPAPAPPAAAPDVPAASSPPEGAASPPLA
jgi:hypothetical protein